MRYRVDLTLNPKQTIDVFRQTLRNDSEEAVTVSLTNITKNELVRNINFLIANSERLINEGVMPEGANKIVDFKVYDNPKRIGGRRNITFTSSINKDDYLCKFIDSAEVNEEETSFLDTKYDVSMYLRHAGNPEVVARQFAAISEVVKEEVVEEVVKEEVVEEVVTEQEVVEEVVKEEVVEEVVTEQEVVEGAPEAEVEEVVVVEEVEVKEVKTYTKGEDGKFYCPFEDCEKHKEGYATERAMKNHMLKVHEVEC